MIKCKKMNIVDTKRFLFKYHKKIITFILDRHEINIYFYLPYFTLSSTYGALKLHTEIMFGNTDIKWIKLSILGFGVSLSYEYNSNE